MASDIKVPVVICWHMHQPSYYDKKIGRFLFPWVYLHCIKDYSDMAAHLEAHPDARAVVNFAPVLLEQIETYLVDIARWRQGSGKISDPLLAALVSEKLPKAGSPQFLELMEQCLRANPERIIKRFPTYARLAELARLYHARPYLQLYIDTAFLADLLVWHHLGWMGEFLRKKNDCIKTLEAKAQSFSMEDRRALLDVIFETLAAIGPRYRHLARTGQVELSASPHTHPILPLMLDFASARDAMPDIPLPEHPAYPGGDLRVRWQLQKAREVFKRFFDVEPEGCWASEGGLSQQTLAFLQQQGFTWTASGDSVIHHSLQRAKQEKKAHIHQPFTFGDTDLPVYFRDDGLSDLIGFTYADWHAEDAVGDLISHMETIVSRSSVTESPVISIIMDGENAWEYYPNNGYYFLDELYSRLTAHPQLFLSTYRDLNAKRQSAPLHLPSLVAGSWIYGTFSTWIGDADKNRAWDLLCEAKLHYDHAMDSDGITAEQKEAARLQLAVCEGSDWFWWFGDYNPAKVVSEFDHLYRQHLLALYDLIQHPAPAGVFQQLSQGSGTPTKGGTMRPGHNGDGER